MARRLTSRRANMNAFIWPQPDAPRPGWEEKDQLENELHAEVLAADAAGSTVAQNRAKALPSEAVRSMRKLKSESQNGNSGLSRLQRRRFLSALRGKGDRCAPSTSPATLKLGIA
jgi:hypothetical protein